MSTLALGPSNNTQPQTPTSGNQPNDEKDCFKPKMKRNSIIHLNLTGTEEQVNLV